MCTGQGGLPTDEMAAATARSEVPAIDAHGHYGAYRSDKKPPMDECCSADAATVVVNPLAPKTFDQAAELLDLPQCAGIKIHPEEHQYHIAEHGRRLFEFAAKHGAIVSSHSGEPNSMPENYMPFVNDFPEATLILAHLGCGWDDDPTHQVRALQASRHGNVYIDTSSAMSLTPRLIEWAVDEVGAERLLYGSDQPCYFAPMQRARIDHAEISAPEKRLILRDNTINLFQLESNSAT